MGMVWRGAVSWLCDCWMERLLARIRLACDRQEIAWRAQRAFSRASGEREMKGYLRLAVLSRRVRISFFSRCIYLGGNRH